MRTIQTLCQILCLFFCVYATGYSENSPLLLFSTIATGIENPLLLKNQSECQTEILEAMTTLSIPVSSDPYSENYMGFSFRKSILEKNSTIVLEIEFFDRGAGVIQVELLDNPKFHGSWRGASRQVSYTRLNTLTTRHAYFQFTVPDIDWEKTDKPHLKISGLEYLHSITLHRTFSEEEWKKAIDSVPVHVKSMVTLKRPMELVCTAGIPVISTPNELTIALDSLRELAPLAVVLGFNAIESYLTWNRIEPEEGKFDFTFYDTVAEKLRQYGLKWFPLLIVGSAYSLPDWFVNSKENIGFSCLEHGQANLIQSIWSPYHKRHVTRVLEAIGKHYEPMNILEGVRLGPSGNYGESQYPAGGNWGYKGEAMHIHIGLWANDPYAQKDYQQFLQKKYQAIESLNKAWNQKFPVFTDIHPRLPEQMYSPQERLDQGEWYTDSMTNWCEWWAEEARKAMPNTIIDQSAGGWGYLQAGTDYAKQAKSMTKIHGGIRLTNETDSLAQNFYVTRLGVTAAKLYQIPVGFEPASSHTARGIVGRIFTATAANGSHFFTYHPNLFNSQLAIKKWLENYSIFDTRQETKNDAAVYYPETMNQLDDSTFRYLYANGFYPRALEIHRHLEIDYMNETLIRDGFLDRYKVLIFVWGNLIEKDILQKIDAWVQKGGTIIYPSFPRGNLQTIEGDSHTFSRWSTGDTGEGHFFRFAGDMEPPSLYGDYVDNTLRKMPNLNPLTKQVLQIQHPDFVYFSLQADGYVLAVNYNNEPAEIELPDKRKEKIEPYSIVRFRMQ